MLTFIIILIIVPTIIVAYCRYKQEQIVGLSQQEILEKHRNAFTSYRNWLIFSILLFVGGYLLAKCYPMYETEEYEYWFFGTHKDTREVLTTTAWWSYILRTLGVLIGIPTLIGLLDRWRAIRRYEKMSLNDYTAFQQQVQEDITKQDESTKRAKRFNSIINNIGKIINGGN